ncbi:MAG: hypothetical protein WCF92_02980 [bacterium]
MAKKQKDSGKNVALAVGVAGAAVAALAGALFLYGTDEGAKTKKKIKSWTLKAKGEVLEQIENVKNIDKEKYIKIVDGVVKKYQAKMKDNGAEVESFAKDLKRHWNIIAKKHGLK